MMINILAKQSTARLISFSVALTALVGVLDYFFGADLSFALFYLIPIAIAAWFTTRGLGMAIAILSATVWLGAHLLAENSRSHHLIHAWETVTSAGFFVVIAYLLSGLKRALDQERQSARTDYLTGVANLRSFYELVDMEIQRSERYDHPMTIAYVDVDDFKVVNDQFGHRAGDQLLKIIADTMRQTLRSVDHIARLGGDEFALLLPETSSEAAQVVLCKVQQQLLEKVQQHGCPVTFSIGVVTYTDGLGTVDQIMQHADAEMYIAKNNGKNRIIYQVLGEQHMSV